MDIQKLDAKVWDIRNYVDKQRWFSFYYQLNEIIKMGANSILEVGVGTGLLRMILKDLMHYKYESVDVDEELKPDHICSVHELPFSENSKDIICCFQVLEHLPYELFEKSLSEMFRVASKAVIISLPNSGKIMRLHIPKICRMKFVKIPYKLREHKYGGIHYWEINKKGYELGRIKNKMLEISAKYGFKMDKEYRVWENPYHHFFIFEKSIKLY